MESALRAELRRQRRVPAVLGRAAAQQLRWPGSLAAAAPIGARVLELGCGLGLPSIAAALCGAHVLATDRSTDALTFTTYNAALNGTSVEVGVCSVGRRGGGVEPGAVGSRCWVSTRSTPDADLAGIRTLCRSRFPPRHRGRRGVARGPGPAARGGVRRVVHPLGGELRSPSGRRRSDPSPTAALDRRVEERKRR